MSRVRILLGAAIVAVLSTRAGVPPAARVPVLVELFTSEGCSSCPPADVLLESLQREQPVPGAEIIALGLHVDYFNHLGWKDSFSSSSHTARQQDYSQVFGPDSVYTPQIVVDGREEFVGTKDGLIRRAISSAAGRPHLPLQVTARRAGDTLRLAIDLPSAPVAGEKIHVLAAVTEDGLSSVVKRGENNGRTLHHVAVARIVKRFESLPRDPSTVEREIRLARNWGPDGLKAVVWLQGLNSRHVYAASTAPINR
jgi:hypothetical protein